MTFPSLIELAHTGQADHSSIPNAGSIGLVEHGLLRDAYQLVRVVKASSRMWSVEVYYRDGTWQEPRRRKVRTWLPLPDGANPDDVKRQIRQFDEEMRSAEKLALARLHKNVKDYASAYAHGGDRS